MDVESFTMDIDKLIAEDPYIRLNKLLEQQILQEINHLKKINQNLLLKIAEMDSKIKALSGQNIPPVKKIIKTKSSKPVINPLSSKILCECGFLISKQTLPHHIKTNKHQIIILNKKLNHGLSS